MNGIRLAHAPSTPLNSADKTALPTRIKLLNWGVNQTTEGDILVDDLTVKLFADNQKAIGRENVQMDFEHNTVPGTPEFKRTQEPRPVAGHGQITVIPGQGIFAENVTYTTTGQSNAGNYKDVSLTPWLDKSGRVIAAHSFALTHAGAAPGMEFAQAPETLSALPELAAEIKTLSACSGEKPNPNHKHNMSEKFITLASLAALVGLSADTEEGAVMTKLKTSLTPPAAVDLAPLSARIAALEGRTAGTVDLAPLTARLDALETKFKTQADAVTTADRTRLITLMASEGKAPINPTTNKAYTAEELKSLDLPTLQILQANTASTVPLSARTRTLNDGNGGKFRVKGADGKDTGAVDLAALFDAENATGAQA